MAPALPQQPQQQQQQQQQQSFASFAVAISVRHQLQLNTAPHTKEKPSVAIGLKLPVDFVELYCLRCTMGSNTMQHIQYGEPHPIPSH